MKTNHDKQTGSSRRRRAARPNTKLLLAALKLWELKRRPARGKA